MFAYLFLLAIVGQALCAPAPHHNVQKRQIFGVGHDFGRALPNSVYHGEFGSLFGSPVFGPGLMGPFNDPIMKQVRISDLFNEIRRINGRPSEQQQFRLNPQVNLNQLPLTNFLGGSAGMASMGALGPMGMMG